MFRTLIRTLALIFALEPALALAQSAPATMQPNSVYGRLGGGVAGPGQSIPFATLQAQFPNINGVNAKTKGVKQDGIAITPTVSISSGSGALLATGAAFTAADVGKQIMVQGAGSASGYLTTTIASFTDATHVGLTATAGTTVTTTAKSVTYCTDDFANIAAAVTSVLANNQTLVFTDGIVCHSGKNNWAFNNLHVQFPSDNTVFIHTGTGIANSFEGFANLGGQGAVGGVFGGPGRPMLRGNPNGNTTVEAKFDNWHFGYFKAALRDATTALQCRDGGIVNSSAVETTFDIRISNNTDGAFIIQPNSGVDCTKPAGSLFERPIVEGTGANSSKQWIFTGAIANTIRGGTIESGSAGGLIEDSTSSRNTYINLDIEVNGTAADWTLNGTNPVLTNCTNGGTASGSIFGSTGATLIGGTFTSLTNNDSTLWSNATKFLTAFTNNGTHTTVINATGAAAPSPALEAATSTLENKSFNTTNGNLLFVNTKAVTDMVGAGPVVVAADVMGLYGAKVVSVNFNAANTDTAIPIVLPAGFTRFSLTRLAISHASQTLTTSTFGLFSTTGGGGVALIAGGTANTISSSADAANNNAMAIGGSSLQSFVAASLATPNTLYFRVGTAQGAAATADVTIEYYPLP